jgi:PLP dependent protein
MLYQNLLTECKTRHAQLIAVSKTQSIESIKLLYQQGQLHFGENKVQELLDKYETLPKDIKWHLIGHLQTNKVKYIVPFVSCIHSVDSIKLLEEIEKEASKIYRKVNILLQFHIAEEDTKYGLDLKEAYELLEYFKTAQFEYVQIKGIMGMATFTENENQIQKEFQQLKQYFQLLKDTYFTFDNNFKEISMGMSSDYKIALQEGSTMIRIGSLLFGARN